MGSCEENVDVGSGKDAEVVSETQNPATGDTSDSGTADNTDSSLNVSAGKSTSDTSTYKDDSLASCSKKNKKKFRHGKKGHILPKECTDRNSIRRVPYPTKYKQCRKRAQSFSSLSKYFLPFKRPRKDIFIPPTKFLLGGNISDPLNLNSLQDEDINRAMNAVTPESSPLPTPPRHKAKIDVIIPPNIRDPLNLMDPVDNDEYEKRLAMQQRKPRKKPRLRRRTTETRLASPVHDISEVAVDQGIKEPLPPQPSSSKSRKRSSSECENAQKAKENKKLRRMDSLDKIVSPVVPQPGAWMRPRQQSRPAPSERPFSPHRVKADDEGERKLPTFHAKNTRYQFGNYDRYYGYRNLNSTMDVRLQVFEMHRYLFQNKDVLDIGCNVGHIAIAVARTLGARSVVGIDIDSTLIGRARNNLKSFVPIPSEPKPHVTSILSEPEPHAASIPSEPKPHEATVPSEPKPHEATVPSEPKPHEATVPSEPKPQESSIPLEPKPHEATVPSEPKPHEATVASDPKPHEAAVPSEPTPHEPTVPSEPKPHAALESEDMKSECNKSKETTDCDETINCDKSLSESHEIQVKDDSNKKHPTGRKIRKPKKNRKATHKDVQTFFPMSMSMLYGPLGDPAAEASPPAFPYNVTFKQGNYVPLEEVAIGSADCGKFDLILCLSTTKWLHLNWGDAGIKRAFRKMFNDLRPGGKLVIEAQNWASYKKKKRLTPTIYENFNAIELLPDKFREYLLSPEVGFSRCCVLGVPEHTSKGFRRPIQLYIKGEFTPSKARWSDAHAPSSHHRTESSPLRKTVYAPVAAVVPSRPSDELSCGAATPYSPNLECNLDDSPFYNPRSDSYAPSYVPPRPTVYATIPSPIGSASPLDSPSHSPASASASDSMSAKGFPEPKLD